MQSSQKWQKEQTPQIKVESLEKEIQQESTLSVSKKRVQFNQIVTEAEFEKESEELNSQQNSQNNNKFQSQSQSHSQSQEDSDMGNSQELNLANYEGISSDEEEYLNGNFLKYMKMENKKNYERKKLAYKVEMSLYVLLLNFKNQGTESKRKKRINRNPKTFYMLELCWIDQKYKSRGYSTAKFNHFFQLLLIP